MDIKALAVKDQRFKAAIETIEDRRRDLRAVIVERWRLIFKTGYFQDWRIEGNTVVISYERPRGGGPDEDRVPIAIFEPDDTSEAMRLWEEEKHRRESQQAERQKQADLEEYRRLGSKLGV